MRRCRHLYPACDRCHDSSRSGAGRSAIGLWHFSDRHRARLRPAAAGAADEGGVGGILTGGSQPVEVAAAGMILGAVLLVLGISGLIGRLARAIPQSVGAGLQLGLGLLMGCSG